ncbi:hypothetical protein VPNG_06062 [Cytospora leucostoma]|uniref:F-box domain-containing protein n=1 Tax=Cytospora leucostoma TaxID=1230097 RepID=A0A423WX47_9PEZI|nr:hypothetical protein VPNG_06062 [Cytospora leucostoma]
MSLFRRRPAPASSKPLKQTTDPAPNHHIDSLLSGRPSGIGLMDLPPEIHLLIGKELIYPDALSLKHTSRYFYSLIKTGVSLKVAWLMERRMLHLDCPKDRMCILRTDREFCRGSVSLLMRRRREHIEYKTLFDAADAVAEEVSDVVVEVVLAEVVAEVAVEVIVKVVEDVEEEVVEELANAGSKSSVSPEGA